VLRSFPDRVIGKSSRWRQRYSPQADIIISDVALSAHHMIDCRGRKLSSSKSIQGARTAGKPPKHMLMIKWTMCSVAAKSKQSLALATRTRSAPELPIDT